MTAHQRETAEWIRQHQKHLETFIAIKKEDAQLGFLSTPAGLKLLEGVGFFETWLLTRHVQQVAKGSAVVKKVRDEAMAFFLLGAAADAAGNHYAKSGEASIQESAVEGINMLYEALNTKGDPMNLRSAMTQKVQWWLGLVKERGDARPDSVHQKGKKAKKTKSDPARDALLRKSYEVLHPIAAGAFSTILKCRHAASGLEVAVKSFDAAVCAKDPMVGDARDRELGVLHVLSTVGRSAKADEPKYFPQGRAHIACMLEMLGGIDTPHMHAVLEFAVGGSLSRHLNNLNKGDKSKGMEPATVQVCTYQITCALAHLHALEIAHADLKPANVLLVHHVPDGRPLDPNTLHLKLCDFGFAWQCGGGVKSKTFCGTPPYLAPEVASPTDASKGYYGRPVDMWALGCLIYELLHKSMAFQAPEQFQLESRIRNAHHQPIAKDVPSGARSLISGLLTIKVASRLTAEQVLEHPWVRDAPQVDIHDEAAELMQRMRHAAEVAKDPLGHAATDHLAELGLTDASGKDDWGRQKKKRVELAKQGKVPLRAQAAQQQARAEAEARAHAHAMNEAAQQQQQQQRQQVPSPTTSEGVGKATTPVRGKGTPIARKKAGAAKGKRGGVVAAPKWDDSKLAASFIPAEHWGGPKEKMVFRSGTLGQGYYLDINGGAELPTEQYAGDDEIEVVPAPTGTGIETETDSAASSPGDASAESRSPNEAKKEEGGWFSWLGIAA